MKRIISTITVCFMILCMVACNREHTPSDVESSVEDTTETEKIADEMSEKTTSVANQNAKQVSIIQLIATPEKYDGQLVRVIGVGNLEFEGNCISLSKEDLEYSVGNQIWIELGEQAPSYEDAAQFNGEYVIIEGVFDKDDCGHMGMFHGSIKNISRYELWDVYKYYSPYDMYSITRNEDMTYSFQIVDKYGDVLFSKDHFPREPEVEQVNSYVLGLTVQSGTGRSTNWAVFCDVENSRISETFQYVLTAQGDYVIYANYENGEYSVIVQNIFDKSDYYKKHVLTNCSPVATDFVLNARLNGEGIAVVTYLEGEEQKETDLTVKFP